MNASSMSRCAAIAALALLAATASAAPPAAMLRETIDWVVADIGLPRPSSEPRIVLASPARIAAIRYGGLLAPPGQRETVAAYDFGRSLQGEFGIDGLTLLASVHCLW